MNGIGGFFELELPRPKGEYHNRAFRFNLARSALAGHLLASGSKKVYLPAYCCGSLASTLSNHGINYSFYNVDSKLDPSAEIDLADNEHFLYVNYFGLKGATSSALSKKYGSGIVVDNSQSFFSPPPAQGAAIYSARKFFGVPDGAYLYSNEWDRHTIDVKRSQYGFRHLIDRIEYGPEKSYQEYRSSEAILKSAGMANMSDLTRRVLSCIDYEYVKDARVNNFNFLDKELSGMNLSPLGLRLNNVPLAYPFLCKGGGALREYLIKNKVYVATYWQDVLSNINSSVLERSYVKDLVLLPIDQRYSADDMTFILDNVKRWLA